MIIKSWSLLAVAGIVFVLLIPGLIWCIASLVKGNRSDTLASTNLAPQQEINLPAAGDVVVMVQMPQLASGFDHLQIELTDKQSGYTDVLKYSYAQAQGTVHGFGVVKMPFGRVAVPRAGVYNVRVSGMDAGKDYSSYELIFSRPYLGRMALQIIGIVVCAVGMLGSLIWAAWLAGLMKQGTP